MDSYIEYIDCFKGTNDLKDCSIDHIISDIPYNIKLNKEWDINFNFVKIAEESNRLLKPNGNCIIFGGWDQIGNIRNIFENAGFKLNNIICYDRIKGRGGKYNFTSTREEIFWFIKKDLKTNEVIFNKEFSTIKKKTKGMGLKNGSEYRSLSNVWSDISPVAPMSKEYLGVSCQKPLKLMQRLVKVFTNEKDLVLDYTIGSGTTIEACIIENRKYIGFENDELTYNIAKERIRKALEKKK
jgi:site-specific DNA-methyltransferase (adenine-specific)